MNTEETLEKIYQSLLRRERFTKEKEYWVSMCNQIGLSFQDKTQYENLVHFYSRCIQLEVDILLSYYDLMMITNA